MDIIKYKVFESKSFNKKFRNILNSLGVIQDGKIDLKDMMEKISTFLSDDKNKNEFLKELKDEIKPNVQVNNITIKAKKLKPSQNAIYLDNIIPRLVVKDYDREQILNGDLREHNILISSDNHVIDGHHRWAACFLLNPNCKIHLTQILLPIDYALPLVNAMMSAHTGKVGEVEKFNINIYDLFDKPKDAVYKAINDLVSRVIQHGSVVDGEKMQSDENWIVKEKLSIDDKTTSAFYDDIKKKLKLDKHPLKYMRKNMLEIPIPKKRFSSRDEMPHVKERDARSYL